MRDPLNVCKNLKIYLIYHCIIICCITIYNNNNMYPEYCRHEEFKHDCEKYMDDRCFVNELYDFLVCTWTLHENNIDILKLN